MEDPRWNCWHISNSRDKGKHHFQYTLEKWPELGEKNVRISQNVRILTKHATSSPPFTEPSVF